MSSSDQRTGNPHVTDELCTAILAAGLWLGVVDADAVVAWADGEIGRRADVPPPWLIELSLSKRRHVLDVIAILNEVAGKVDRRAVFAGVCSLLPDLNHYDFDQCEALARRLYRTAYELFEGDWNCELLAASDEAADAFEWQRDGCIADTRDQVAATFRAFVDGLRDDAVRCRLATVSSTAATPTASD